MTWLETWAYLGIIAALFLLGTGALAAWLVWDEWREGHWNDDDAG